MTHAGRTLPAHVIGLGVLGIANALFLVWGGQQTSSGGAFRQLSAVLIANGVGCASLLWIALDRRFGAMPLWCPFVLALVVRLIATQASPLLEDDHYRYLWDGFRTATSVDPYRLAPSAFFGAQELPQRWQDVLSGINNPDITTIYGPVLQWLFALAYWIAPGQLGAIQALLLLLDMAVLVLLSRLGLGCRALLAYSVHPLILKEAMASAHPDGVLALFLLLALFAWRRRDPGLAGIALGLAVGTKIAALVAAPLLLLVPMVALTKGDRGSLPIGPTASRLTWGLRLVLGCGVTLLVLYLPFVLAGGSDLSALAVFGTQWRFNPLLFRVLERSWPDVTARVLAGVLILVGVGLLAWKWQATSARGRILNVPPVDSALALLLLFAPAVNPWYWLWALPLALNSGRYWIVVAGAASVLSYWNSTVLFEAGLWPSMGAMGPYVVAWPIALLQLSIIAASWCIVRIIARCQFFKGIRSVAIPSSGLASNSPSVQSLS